MDIERLYAFVSGPMVWISLALFVAGLVAQGLRFFKLTRAREPNRLPPPPHPAAPKKKRGKGAEPQPLFKRLLDLAEAMGRPFDRLFQRACNTIAGTHPLTTALTVVFHVLLFATPILLIAHNTLIARAIGFGLPSLPDGLADLMTVVFLLCGGAFLYRRIFMRRVRAITTLYDYLVLLITVLPYLTGFLAYHQVGEYRTMITTHVITGELMLILVPFTRLGHALFFFLYRFLLGGEYGFGQGKRAW